MGLDIGEKRIGVALSDPDEILASPLTILNRDTDDNSINQILDLMKVNSVKKVVIGLPYSLNGSLSQQTLRTREYIKKIKAATDADVITRDERYSTVAARNLIAGTGMKKNKKRQFLDAASAAYILQGFLDSQKIADNN